MTWKTERDCGRVELYGRKFVTSVFYFRGYRRLFPDRPFYTPRAIKFVKKKLSPETRVFEFGSGISSTWFAQRVGEYIAVEHDKAWHEQVVAQVKARHFDHARVLFQPDFEHYVTAIDPFPDGHFHIISVDGRERVKCLARATPKLAPNGILIFDDAHRSKYREIWKTMSDWHVRKFDFGLQQTAVFSRQAI